MPSSLVRCVVVVCASLAFGAAASADVCLTRNWVKAQEVALDDFVDEMTVIDYDDDGIPDLAASTQDNPSQLITMRGLGDGTFAAASVLYTSSNTVISGSFDGLAVADVDSDGDQDLLAGHFGDLLVFHGTGSGLAAPVATGSFGGVRTLAVVNLDADPAPELAAGFSNGRLSVYDNAAGSFVEMNTVTGSGQIYLALAAGDFDGDTRVDLAAARFYAADTPGTVDVYFRNANGTFAAPVILQAGSYPTALATADFDGDGRIDIAATNREDNTVTVFAHESARQFSASTLDAGYPDLLGGTALELATGDLTGDGIPDLLAGLHHGWVSMFAGLGDGTFRTPAISRFPANESSIHAMVVHDFDADGDPDLGIGSSSKTYIASPGPCATQVILTAEAAVISSNAEARLNVAISGFASDTPQPFGTVTLRKGAETVGTASPDALGKVSFLVPPMPAGNHTFTAEFSGNAQLPGATSAPLIQKVTNATTTTTLTVPQTSPVYGTPWPVTITVSTGYEIVDVHVDGVVTTHYTFNPFQANLTPGQHTIYARFRSRNVLPASTSQTIVVTAQKATPTLGLAGITIVRSGEAHTVHVTAFGPAGTVTPTGSVQLFSGATPLASAVLSGGTASIPVTLQRGAHAIRVVYSGDAFFTTAESALTLHTLPNQPLAMEARALESAIQIVYVVPANTVDVVLRRRLAGTQIWYLADGWNKSTGIDSFIPPRGVVYEYQLQSYTSNGGGFVTDPDSAMLFTDDPVAAGATPVKRVHLGELRTAVNLLRAKAGLAPFAFDATFDSSSVVRAQHLQSLQTAASQARSLLGMAAPAFDFFTAGSAVNAAHLRQTRDAVR